MNLDNITVQLAQMVATLTADLSRLKEENEQLVCSNNCLEHDRNTLEREVEDLRTESYDLSVRLSSVEDANNERYVRIQHLEREVNNSYTKEHVEHIRQTLADFIELMGMNLQEACKVYVNRNEVIRAIRLYRTVTGAGLKESKDIIDTWREGWRLQDEELRKQHQAKVDATQDQN